VGGDFDGGEMTNQKEIARNFDSATQQLLGTIIDTKDKKLIELARANAGLILHFLDRIH
jgi:hypothetical protein